MLRFSLLGSIAVTVVLFLFGLWQLGLVNLVLLAIQLAGKYLFDWDSSETMGCIFWISIPVLIIFLIFR